MTKEKKKYYKYFVVNDTKTQILWFSNIKDIVKDIKDGRWRGIVYVYHYKKSMKKPFYPLKDFTEADCVMKFYQRKLVCRK